MSDRILSQSPLSWPEGWPRTDAPVQSNFYRKGQGWDRLNHTVDGAIRFTLAELKRMGVDLDTVVVSTNLRLRNDGFPYSQQKTPEDCGAAVWWKKDNVQQVIAIDQYKIVADNIYAIGKTIEALRSIDRWGSGGVLNRTLHGLAELPSPEASTKLGWRQVLKTQSNDLNEVRKVYLKARKEAHEDHGGSAERFDLVQRAWAAAEQELG